MSGRWLLILPILASLAALSAFEISARAGLSIPESLAAVVTGILGILVLARAFGFNRASRRRRRLLGMDLDQLDRLEGRGFEAWIVAILEADDFRIERTPPGGDFGVDLVAEFDGFRIGIEAKRRNAKISNAVVRSIVAGCQFHGCHAAAVITNSVFTRQAVEQAARSDPPVLLLGRADLLDLAQRLRALRP